MKQEISSQFIHPLQYTGSVPSLYIEYVYFPFPSAYSGWFVPMGEHPVHWWNVFLAWLTAIRFTIDVIPSES